MAKLKVLIADDHSVLRAGLRMLIDAQPDMEVVGEAADGRDAVAKALVTEPNVVLMDLTMPTLDGIQATAQLRSTLPETRVLILTMHHDAAYERSAAAAGASGRVVKDATPERLLAAIRAVSRGDLVFDSIVEFIADEATPPQISKRGTLCARERQVLQLVASGHTNQQIADQVSLSVKTVETYRARVAEKLGLRTRADFVSAARFLRPTDCCPSVGVSLTIHTARRWA
jgi:two-component system response regulator NreC